MERAWERARGGAHVAVLGAAALAAPPEAGWTVVRVSCVGPPTTWGPLEEARRRIERVLGDGSVLDQARDLVVGGLRRRLLGELPASAGEAGFVEDCNRLAAEAEGPAALVIEHADAMDASTGLALAAILRRPGWLRLPLVLCYRLEPKGAPGAPLEALRELGGEGAVLSVQRSATAAAGEAQAAFDWNRIPPEALRVLRAGSVLGEIFEAELLARLLQTGTGKVLDALQRAADAGAPIADLGDGRFALPPDAARKLQSRVLPSLLAWWHQRAAALLSPTPATPVAPGAPEAPPPAVPGGPVPYEELLQAAVQAAAEQVAATEPEPPPPPPPPAPEPAAPPPAAAEPRSEMPTPPSDDHLRAAHHLQAAGETDAALDRYLDAAEALERRGDPRRALHLLGEALQLADNLPPGRGRALARVRVLLAEARLRWQGASLEPGFQLDSALQALDAASESMPPDAPLELRTELSYLIAGVCYDRGDLRSLERALDELVAATRRLLEAQRGRQAARLLNDQAAIYVRLGDPVRASHHLTRAREFFEDTLARDPQDRLAREELAETDHLLSRLPMHAPIRPGREAEAWAVAIEHAQRAARAYEAMGDRRELGRTLETLGRLHHRAGKPDLALAQLQQALRLQDAIGDAVGLARTTAALADALVAVGRPEEALGLLANSVGLNHQKGSPIGLAYNRRAFDALVAALQGAAPLRGALVQVEQQLAAAEAQLGRLVLPGESG